MERRKKSVLVPTVILSTLGWGFFVSEAIKHSNKELEDENNIKYTIEDIEKLSIPQLYEQGYKNINDEYERLKEEERLRLEELERQRLEKVEQERLAKLKAEQEAEKARLIKIEEDKKKAMNSNVGNWMTFNGSYYGANCYQCSGITATGIDVRNSIYYDGLRIIALDPNTIPLWTIVEVKTPNETFKALVADTGGRIKGRNADILVESEAVSYQYGRHDIQIRVIGKYNK